MKKEKHRLNIAKIFRDEAEELIKAREKCIQIHGSNIRAAGNEVEMSVRDFFKRILPKKYYVTNGHLIDRNGIFSPQIDLIISDYSTIPSLMTTNDGTEYIPIDSVYAIGEIKSTFYPSQKYLEKYSDTLRFIRTKMTRPIIENTIHEGIKDRTFLRDMYLGKPNKYHNPLFSFILFVNSGDGTIDGFIKTFSSLDDEYIPSMTISLNRGVVCFSNYSGKNFTFNKYPFLDKRDGYGWHLTQLNGELEDGSLEGNHLAFLYFVLLTHLNECYLEPPDLRPYLSRLLTGSRSTTIEIKKT